MVETTSNNHNTISFLYWSWSLRDTWELKPSSLYYGTRCPCCQLDTIKVHKVQRWERKEGKGAVRWSELKRKGTRNKSHLQLIEQEIKILVQMVLKSQHKSRKKLKNTLYNYLFQTCWGKAEMIRVSPALHSHHEQQVMNQLVGHSPPLDTKQRDACGWSG